MKLLKYIPEGGLIPFWYGYCYYDFNSETKAMLPIPLNMLWRWLRNLWYWLKEHTQGSRLIEQAYWAGLRRGRACVEEQHSAGYNEGYRAGYNEAFGRIEAIIDNLGVRADWRRDEAQD